MSLSTSIMDLNTASPTFPPTSRHNQTSSLPCSLSVSSIQVKRQLEGLNQNPAAEPDGVSRRVLKDFVEQLCDSTAPL